MSGFAQNSRSRAENANLSLATASQRLVPGWRERRLGTVIQPLARRFAAHAVRARSLTAREQALLAEARAALSFDLLVPGRLPFGSRLAGVDLVDYATSMATLVFEGPRRRQFRLTERLSSVTLAEEVAVLGHPGRTVELRSRRFWVVAGSWAAGEPVDGWHWHLTRQTIAWQAGPVICEIEQIRRLGFPLELALEIARATTVQERGSRDE
ncbi:MAG: hypothetical protein JWQ48_2998 [Conexibacter sp.]|nr:hypothetical protein [Conexibacter sp.]